MTNEQIREERTLKEAVEIDLQSKRFLRVIDSFDPEDRLDILGILLAISLETHGSENVEYATKAQTTIMAEMIRNSDSVPLGSLNRESQIQHLNELLVELSWKSFCDSEKINIDKRDMSDSSDSGVMKFWQQFYAKHGRMFHGTTSYGASKILENGMRPLNVFETDTDLGSLAEIYARRSLSSAFGWGSFQEKAVYTSTSPMDACDYAYRSPEWFAHWVSKSMNHRQVDEEDEFIRLHAFELRDKGQCLRNIQKLNQENDLSVSEQEMSEQLFEKYWNMYCSETNNFCMVGKPQGYEGDFLPDLIELVHDTSTSRDLSIVTRIGDYQTHDQRQDYVSPEGLTAIELPKFSDLNPDIVDKYWQIQANKFDSQS